MFKINNSIIFETHKKDPINKFTDITKNDNETTYKNMITGAM